MGCSSAAIFPDLAWEFAMEPRPSPANPRGPIAKMVQQFKLALGKRRNSSPGPNEARSKRWLATYGARIPAEIDPNAYGSVPAMLEEAMQRFAVRPAFRCFGQTLTYTDTDGSHVISRRIYRPDWA